jgi:hypothetical protein
MLNERVKFIAVLLAREKSFSAKELVLVGFACSASSIKQAPASNSLGGARGGLAVAMKASMLHGHYVQIWPICFRQVFGHYVKVQ